MYNINEEPIVISKPLLDLLLEQKKPADLISLYTFYYYTAKWQKTNIPKCTTGYVAKGLKWSTEKVIKTKKKLKDLQLIEDIQNKNAETGKITGWYIKVNFIWSKEVVEKEIKNHPMENPEGGENHRVEKVGTNALNTNSLNALNTNKETSSAKAEETADSDILGSSIQMSSVEKPEMPKSRKRRTLSSPTELAVLEIYTRTAYSGCRKSTTTAVEGIPRALRLFAEVYGKDNAGGALIHAIGELMKKDYWQGIKVDKPFLLYPKKFFNKTFIENNLIPLSVKKYGTNNIKTESEEERRKRIQSKNKESARRLLQ